MLRALSSILKDLIFPKQCFSCKAWGNFICEYCSEQLKSQNHQRCLVCQKPSLGGWTHPKCKTTFTPDRLITIFDYHDQTISRLINTAKLSLTPEIFSELAHAGCNRLVIQSLSWQQFVLCPIPLTRLKTRWRGFNQTELVAQKFSKHFSMAIDKVLQKSRTTKQQKELNKQQRLLNLHQSFQIAQEQYIPKHIVLIDDITTTGSTFLEAGKVLKRAGVKTVWCLALAQD